MDFQSMSEMMSAAMQSQDKIYMGIIAIFVLMQLFKKTAEKKVPGVRKAAPQITAGASSTVGALIASQMGQSPSEGAVAGLLMGNAASGMYDTLKPLGRLGKKFLAGRRKQTKL